LQEKTKELETIKWTEYDNHHVPHKNTSWKDIIESTIRGKAKYKHGLNIKDLEISGWKSGTQVSNGQNWKVFKFDQIIGAVSGKETDCIVIKCSANTIHGHPILNSDYMRLLKK